MSKIDLYLSRIVKYGLYAVLLTPLAFWPPALYAFLTPKFISFQILIEIVFAAWLILKIKNSNFKNLSKFRNRPVIALLAFIAVSFVSAVLGADFYRSMWSIGARMTGLFAELHFFAWFLILIDVLDNGKENPAAGESKGNFPKLNWKAYLDFSFFTSVAVALTAFFTNTGWRLVPGYTIFSNPTFAAPYFLFNFFWGIYRAADEPAKIKKWLFGIGGILILWAIFLGQIRGALVGLILGVLLLGAGLVFGDILKKRSRILFGILYAAVIIGLFLVWQFRDTNFIEHSYFGRFSHLSFRDETTQIRLLTWQSAFAGIKSDGLKQLLLGVGPENFNYLFNAHYNPHLLMYGGSSFAETWQDKPHNAFIQIVSETGIIGFAAYALIWLAAAFLLLKIYKRGEKFLSLALAGGFISYLASIFFAFDSFGSWFGMYLFLGFLALYADFDRQADRNFANAHSVLKNAAAYAILIVAAYLLLLNYSIWRANLADADALRTFSKDPAAGIDFFRQSLAYKSPYKSEYRFDLIASIGGAVEKGLPIPDLENNLNFALNEADEAIAAHPNNAGSYTDMARIYNIFGMLGRDPALLNQAASFGEKSLTLSPDRQETLFYLARTALLKNDPNQAVLFTKRAVDADSSVNISHWYLGLAYIAAGRPQEGKIEIQKALGLGYQPRNQAERDFIKNLGL